MDLQAENVLLMGSGEAVKKIHESQATLGPVGAWMGDRPGSPITVGFRRGRTKRFFCEDDEDEMTLPCES